MFYNFDIKTALKRDLMITLFPLVTCGRAVSFLACSRTCLTNMSLKIRLKYYIQILFTASSCITMAYALG